MDTNLPEVPLRHLDLPGGHVAYKMRPGRSDDGPGVIFLHSLKRDMSLRNAEVIDRYCAQRGLAYTRFDFRGHGASSGQFVDCSIGLWLQDALAVLEQVTRGPQLLVGYSLGSWISLLVARARPEQVGALLMVVPVPDFPTNLILPNISEQGRRQLLERGEPYAYRHPRYNKRQYEFSRHFFQESRKHHVMDGNPVRFPGPVRIVCGGRDPAISLEYFTRVLGAVDGPNVTMTIIKDGDHDLERPQDTQEILRHLTICLDHLTSESD